MKRIRSRLLSLAFALAWPALGLAQPSGLDAPVAQQPTVRSEIRHGFEAGAGCKELRKVFSKLDRCVMTALERYKATHTSADAFEAGASLWRWAAADTVAQDGEAHPSPRDLAAVRAAGAEAYASVTGSARVLGVSVHEVFEASGIAPEFEARFTPDVLAKVQESPETLARKGDCAEAIIAAEHAGGAVLQSVMATCSH